MLYVLFVGCSGRFQATGVDGLLDVLKALFVKSYPFKAKDIICAASAVRDVRWHLGFEGAVPDEDDDGMDGALG